MENKPFDAKKWQIPYISKLKNIIDRFSLTEKVIFGFFSVLMFISAISIVWRINKLFLVEVPDYGGSFTEGIIGSPRFVNPLLSTTDIDRDLTAIVYSGLLKANPDGSLSPDLAEKYEISDDGLTYTFTLKKNLEFHDGTKITADDVVFTIEKAKDTTLKSPRKANWDGVNVKKIDDLTVQFSLQQAYSPFIQNTTLGILPKHIWKNTTSEEFPFSQFNINPVGSGPYKVENIKYSSGGLPSEYTFTSFKKYSLGEAYITNITIKSYPNEKELLSAYQKGDIENIHSISAEQIQNLKNKDGNVNIIYPLPRIFGVFFNQNIAPVFANEEVREALDIATNKEEIIKSVLGGYGQIADEPVPAKSSKQEGEWNEEKQIAKAKALLESKGWKQNSDGIYEKKDKKSSERLEFSISTGSAPELKQTAQILQKQWEKLGAIVEVKIFDIGDLNQNIIRPRKYDALLFGEIIGRDMDLYPFWHSSQRLDPGLNIAMYTNLKADKILENIRKTTDPEKQKKLYQEFNQEIKKDTPVIFLYSPYFIYNVPERIKNISFGSLTTSAERFDSISSWYIQTNNVWRIFNKTKDLSQK